MIRLKGIRQSNCLLVCCFIFLGTQSVTGQSYRYFDPERTRSYGIDGENYFFVEIDSVLVEGTDTTFFFKHKVDTASVSCDVKNGISDVIGPQMKIIGDTITYFFNASMDSIKVLMKQPLWNPWVMYNYPDGRYITGTFTTSGYGTIMPGIYDSIHICRFNVYAEDGTYLPDSIPNNWNFDISKNFGVIEFINWNNFPNDTTNFKLRGLSDPDTGSIFDVNARRAFDFDLGNEFHYREEVAPDDASGADLRVSAWKYFVMGKNEAPDQVTYTFENIRFDTLYTDGIPSSTITWDTIDVTINYVDYSFLDTIEMSLFQLGNYGYSDWIMADTLFVGIAHKYVYDWYNYDAPSQCLDYTGSSQPEQLYGNGIGTMHYLDSTNASDYYKLDLVYFQKGLLTWGQPYDFSDLDLSNQDMTINSLLIYPNPADDIITATLNEAGTSDYSIFTLSGTCMQTGQFNSAQNHIDISALPAGVYMLTIVYGGKAATRQFVKLQR